ncbi:hypothetical protein DB30_07691 [Enhygromyxa salina]|uniref:Uncharacterized protein n=1 Tax=Enhygromyxa salina TaxID=215803 RepID=A0A0C2D686_9BACT|nr:hypothetical protein DB30_07691 [Enhygromyxa salina]
MNRHDRARVGPWVDGARARVRRQRQNRLHGDIPCQRSNGSARGIRGRDHGHARGPATLRTRHILDSVPARAGSHWPDRIETSRSDDRGAAAARLHAVARRQPLALVRTNPNPNGAAPEQAGPRPAQLGPIGGRLGALAVFALARLSWNRVAANLADPGPPGISACDDRLPRYRELRAHHRQPEQHAQQDGEQLARAEAVDRLVHFACADTGTLATTVKRPATLSFRSIRR